MLPLLVAIFIVVPLAELYVIIQVGGLIGILPTIALLLVDSIAGSLLLRSQGRAAWKRFNDAMQAGRIPHQEATDGALVIVGGALLLTPGFLTDIFGLALLIPPSRAVAKRILAAALRRRVVVSVGARPAPGPPPARQPYDVEGSATETGTSKPDSRLPRLDS